MPTSEEIMADLLGRVALLETRRYPWQGRVNAVAAGSTAWSAVTAYGAAPDGSGPDVTVQVGPSGRLMVVVSARLATTAGTAPRAFMGWQATGPYLDAARTVTPGGVAATVAVAAADARALAVTGDVEASRVSEATGLAPGWYLVQSRYAVTGTGPAASASLREVIAVPV